MARRLSATRTRSGQAYEGPLSGPWRLSCLYECLRQWWDADYRWAIGSNGMRCSIRVHWEHRWSKLSKRHGVLNDGRKITYALGIVVTNENGLRKVSHGGCTAGYQTFLSRYPGLKLSVAVLCNGTSRNALHSSGISLERSPDLFPPQRPRRRFE